MNPTSLVNVNTMTPLERRLAPRLQDITNKMVFGALWGIIWGGASARKDILAQSKAMVEELQGVPIKEARAQVGTHASRLMMRRSLQYCWKMTAMMGLYASVENGLIFYRRKIDALNSFTAGASTGAIIGTIMRGGAYGAILFAMMGGTLCGVAGVIQDLLPPSQARLHAIKELQEEPVPVPDYLKYYLDNSEGEKGSPEENVTNGE